jgi:hypothetical protein
MTNRFVALRLISGRITVPNSVNVAARSRFDFLRVFLQLMQHPLTIVKYPDFCRLFIYFRDKLSRLYGYKTTNKFLVFRGRLLSTRQILPTNNQFLPSHSEESDTPHNGANPDGLA